MTILLFTSQQHGILDDDTVHIISAADVLPGATLGYAAGRDGAAVSGVSPRWGAAEGSLRGSFAQMAQPNYAVAFEVEVP